MAPPIEAVVLRAWTNIVITCYWDAPQQEGEEGWFVIRQAKFSEAGLGEKTVRLKPQEALKLATLIQATVQGGTGK